MRPEFPGLHNYSHPGQILAHFLEGHTVAAVAAHIGVPRVALTRVLNGKAPVTADMALRLSEAFNTEPGLWLRLQFQYDMKRAAQQKRPRIKPLESSLAA